MAISPARSQARSQAPWRGRLQLSHVKLAQLHRDQASVKASPGRKKRWKIEMYHIYIDIDHICIIVTVLHLYLDCSVYVYNIYIYI